MIKYTRGNYELQVTKDDKGNLQGLMFGNSSVIKIFVGDTLEQIREEFVHYADNLKMEHIKNWNR